MAAQVGRNRKESLASNVESLLNCSICLTQFSTPKILPCAHTFCLRCLKDYDKRMKCQKGHAKCAMCRKISKLPSGGYNNLPNNLTIGGLVDLMKSKRKDRKVEPPPSKKEKPNVLPKPVAAPRTKKGAAASKAPKTATKDGKKTQAKPKAATKKSGGSGRKNVTKAQATAAAKKAVAAAMARNSNKNSRQLPLDRNRNISVDFSDEFSPVDSSDEDSYDSDETGSSCSDSDEGSSDFSDSDLSSCDGSSDSEVAPPTPGIVAWEGIEKGSKVYVFGKRGMNTTGMVRHMEMFRGSMYCGVELAEEMPRLICDSVEEMEGTYLYYWLGDNETPCTVVRLDHCCPVDLVESIMTR